MSIQRLEDRLIDLSILLDAPPVSVAGFGTVLYAVNEFVTPWGASEYVRTYASAADAAADATLTSYVKDAIGKAFAQNPAPARVKVGDLKNAGNPIGDPATLLTAIEAADPDWYGLDIDTHLEADAAAIATIIEGASGWVESRAASHPILYGAQSHDPNILTGGANVFATVKATAVERTIGVYNHASAQLKTGVIGTNNALTWTAKTPGPDGASIKIAIVVAGNETPLSVVVSGTEITVNSATDAGGLATSKASDVITAILASANASALVTAVNTGASTGAGVVAAVVQTALALEPETSQPLDLAWFAKAMATDIDTLSNPWDLTLSSLLPANLTSGQMDKCDDGDVNYLQPYGPQNAINPGVNLLGRPIYQLVSADWYRARCKEDMITLVLKYKNLMTKFPLDADGQAACMAVFDSVAQRGITAGHFSRDIPCVALPITSTDTTLRRLRFTKTCYILDSVVTFALTAQLTRQ